MLLIQKAIYINNSLKNDDIDLKKDVFKDENKNSIDNLSENILIIYY